MKKAKHHSGNWIYGKDKVIRDEAGGLFDKYVTRRITIDFNGNVIFDSNVDGKEINLKTKKMLSTSIQENNTEQKMKKNCFRFLFVKTGGKTVYVVSCSGKGLWDDVWGYIGVSAKDGNTIVAAKFRSQRRNCWFGFYNQRT